MKKDRSIPRPGVNRALSVSPAPDKGQAPGAVSVLGGALRALPITFLCGFVLLLAAAAAAYSQADPDALQTPLAVAAAGVSALVGGFVTVRFNKGAALLSGLTGGILYMGILMILSLCFFRHSGSGYSSTVAFLMHAGVVLLEVIGAFLGLPRKKAVIPGRHKPAR